MRSPNNPVTWVSSPAEGCSDGHLVKFGDITGPDLSLNAYSRFETNDHLSFPTGQYISSVLYKGGLTGLPAYPEADLPACPSPNAVVIDVADADAACPGGQPVQGGGTAKCEATCVGGAWQYVAGPTPTTVDSLPSCPATDTVVSDAAGPDCTPGGPAAGGNQSSTFFNSNIQGTLSVWLCLRYAHASRSGSGGRRH